MGWSKLRYNERFSSGLIIITDFEAFERVLGEGVDRVGMRRED